MNDFEVTAPVYPLSRGEFRRALATGHGRALIHAEEFDAFVYRDDILEAAIRCQVYDPQVEGYRERWLARLCAAAQLIDTVILQEPGKSDHDRTQRARLLREFHRMGHAAALPQLYEMCRRWPGSNQVDAVDELIEADGEKGLLFAARQLGEALAEDPDFWLGGWELSDYDQLHGEGRTLGILNQAAHGDPFIALCLTKWMEVTARQDPRGDPEERKSVDEVVQEISHHREPEVRLAGLALLEKGELADGIRMLRSSAEAGDAMAIRNALTQVEPEDDIHSLCYRIVEMMEHNRHIRDPQIALFVYQVSPCMHCRLNAIKCLCEWLACPGWMLYEAAHDGSEDIRKFVEDWDTARP